MNTLKKFISFILLALLVIPVSASAATTQKATLIKDGKKVVTIVGSSNAQKLFSLGYKLYNGNLVGGNVPSSAINWNLSQPITATQTTIPLTKITDVKGTAVSTTTLPTKIYLTIDPTNSTNVELVVCPRSGFEASNKRFIGCTRGLSFSGTSEASVTSYQLPHSSGVSIIMSNVGQFYNNFVDVDSSQTIAGDKTFTGVTTLATTSITAGTITGLPVIGNDIVNKTYADGIAIAGGADANLTTKGISKLSSNPASSTNPISLNSEEVSTTSGADKVVRASSTGYIDTSFLSGIFSNNNIWTATNTFDSVLNINGTTTYTGNNSLVRVSTSTATTTGRSLGTVYQNTTGKNLFISAIISYTVPTPGTVQQVNFYCDASSTNPSTLVGMAYGSTANMDAGKTVSSNMTISFVVPNNFYYKATSTSGTPSINSWSETQF